MCLSLLTGYTIISDFFKLSRGYPFLFAGGGVFSMIYMPERLRRGETQPPVDMQLVDSNRNFWYNTATAKTHGGDLPMALGENIRKRREELKLSQGYVAERLGVSRQAVSKWETGQSEPTASNLIQLAEVFEMSLSQLVGADQGGGAPPPPEKWQEGRKPNLILRANLIKLAIIAQMAFLFSCTSVIYQLRHPDFPNKDLYRGALIFSLVLLAISSTWMAANHRYEPDKAQRRKNARIELLYCCVQLCVVFLTIRFGMGLVGGALMIAAGCVYILYINPKFMSRKLTK